MQSPKKKLLLELVWLLGVLILTIVFLRLAFLWNREDNTFDIHLHDTYYLVNAVHLVVVTFTLLTFIVFFCRGVANNFFSNLRNWITLISGLSLILLSTTFQRFLIPSGFES